MTDFLSGLLDRALDRAPVLQRRRPSLFEPMPDTARLGAMPLRHLGQWDKEGPDVDVESSRIQAPAFRSAAPPPHHVAAWQTTAPPERENLEPIHSPKTAPPAAPLQSDTRREARQEPNRPPSEKVVLQAVGTAAPPRAIEPPPRVIETIVQKEVEKPQPSTRSAWQQSGRSETPVAASSPLGPPVRPLVAPTVKPHQTNETRVRQEAAEKREAEGMLAKPTKSVVQPVLLPLPRPTFPPMRRQPVIVRETAPATPTIQVTIGRIEVRATPPATPARAVRPAAPKLSLDDYLRSRNGGRR